VQFGSHPVSDCGSKMHRVRKGQSVPAKQQMSAMPIRTRSHSEVPCIVSLCGTHIPDQHHCDRDALRRTLAFLATVVEQLTRLTLVQLKTIPAVVSGELHLQCSRQSIAASNQLGGTRGDK
jgi:hypothetical protein